MARNILKAGFPLVVHNRSRGAVDALVAEGAKSAFSPAGVAAQVDIVFTNLPDSPDVEAVALSRDGIIAGAHEGLIFVDNSTIKPATAREIAKKLGEAGVGGAAQCWALDVKPERLFEGNRRPGFKAYMQAKDLGIVMDTARQYGAPLPSAAVNTQLFNAMIEMGMGDLDNSAVIGVIEALAGAKLIE
jgi:3-hydroxyisobutyrate dehydrogenase-like beta-hydroxyacid dehydrogenase